MPNCAGDGSKMVRCASQILWAGAAVFFTYFGYRLSTRLEKNIEVDTTYKQIICEATQNQINQSKDENPSSSTMEEPELEDIPEE